MRVAEDSPAIRFGDDQPTGIDVATGPVPSRFRPGDRDRQPLRPATIGVRAARIAGNSPPAMPTRIARIAP
jgi:hypothetical protein